MTEQLKKYSVFGKKERKT